MHSNYVEGVNVSVQPYLYRKLVLQEKGRSGYVDLMLLSGSGSPQIKKYKGHISLLPLL